MVINRDNIEKALQHQALRVKFVKLDGSEREMLCTRDWDTLSENADEFGFKVPKGKGPELPANLLRVWSIDDTDWRTINLDTLMSAEVDQ